MTQTTVGIQDLKARLSSYMRQVKDGATLVITERGMQTSQYSSLAYALNPCHHCISFRLASMSLFYCSTAPIQPWN